ncbi:MAG: nuclear transport factor 2 family protein [Actinomycetota bacterium]
MSTDTNREIVARFWATLYARDFEACGAFFADDGVYTDVPVGEVGATGPAEVAARLRLGLERIDGYVHHLRNIAADGDVVMTEHVEEWHWGTGEQVALPFVSVMELRDGKIVRWWDYFNLPTLLDAAPQWWLDHIAQGYK